jgi:hypothetical protein
VTSHLVVHRWSDAPPIPWRNGGGITRELVLRPVDGPDDAARGFGWRVSVAEVAADGPFSPFEGYERILVLLTGAGMDLHVADLDGAVDVVPLRPPYSWHRFGGESAVHATLTDGPTTDLNLMWRRDRFEATVRRFQAPFDLAPQTGATLLAFVADGAPELDDDIHLHRGDVVESTDILHVDGEGTLLVLAIVPR